MLPQQRWITEISFGESVLLQRSTGSLETPPGLAG